MTTPMTTDKTRTISNDAAENTQFIVHTVQITTTPCVKKQDTKLLPVTSPDVNPFSKYFHQQIKWQICNEVTYHNLKCLSALLCDLSLITMHISNYHQFSDIRISQGSVATYLRYGEMFKDDFVANLGLPVSPSGKELWKSVNIWESYGRKFSVLFFDSHTTVLQSNTSFCAQSAWSEILKLGVHASSGRTRDFFKNSSTTFRVG